MKPIEKSRLPSVIAPPSASADLPRLEALPKDVGWLLLGVGFAGFVAPGIFGLPFMVAGGLILWPKGAGRIQQRLARRHPKAYTAGMKQVGRFLNDLDRRYPLNSKQP